MAFPAVEIVTKSMVSTDGLPAEGSLATPAKHARAPPSRFG